MNILLFISALPVFLICYYIYIKDRNKEPIGLLIKLFLFGVFSAIPIIFLELFLGYFLASWENINLVSLFFYYFIVIAFSEELFKFIFTYIGSYNHREFTNLYDMMIYATFVSLGFALFENIIYGYDGGISVGILRALFSVPGHAAFGLIMGYYLGLSKYYKYNNDTWLYKKNMFLSLFVPILIHTFYDFCLSANDLFFLILLFGFVIFLDIFLFIKIREISRNCIDFKNKYCSNCDNKSL